jgi:hypothetical protein
VTGAARASHDDLLRRRLPVTLTALQFRYPPGAEPELIGWLTRWLGGWPGIGSGVQCSNKMRTMRHAGRIGDPPASSLRGRVHPCRAAGRLHRDEPVRVPHGVGLSTTTLVAAALDGDVLDEDAPFLDATVPHHGGTGWPPIESILEFVIELCLAATDDEQVAEMTHVHVCQAAG